jgi:cytoskeletal protein CcmA (bactofilin family)
MWKKPETEDLHPQPAAPADESAVFQPVKKYATIGQTIHIKGDLMGEEDLVIDGYVDGKVRLGQHNVTVGKNGHVRADIYGNIISIEGDVEGNLFGADQLILRKSSKVRGNIFAPRVVLEDGSDFKGNIDMSPREVGEKPSAVKGAASEEAFDNAIIAGSASPAINIADM